MKITERNRARGHQLCFSFQVCPRDLALAIMQKRAKRHPSKISREMRFTKNNYGNIFMYEVDTPIQGGEINVTS